MKSMANGRKMTTSRSERLLGSFGYTHYGYGSANGSPELREDEVWSMADDTATGEWVVGGEWSARASSDGVESVGSCRPSPRADHHRRRRQVGGLSLAFEDSDASDGSTMRRIVHQFRAPESAEESPRGRYVATSAPVNIPDWSKIYRVESVETIHDGKDSELVPPHEYLARSRKMAANSVFEGVGRTLKGRDLSRVRDAVWSQTGFYG